MNRLSQIPWNLFLVQHVISSLPASRIERNGHAERHQGAELSFVEWPVVFCSTISMAFRMGSTVDLSLRKPNCQLFSPKNLLKGVSSVPLIIHSKNFPAVLNRQMVLYDESWSRRLSSLGKSNELSPLPLLWEQTLSKTHVEQFAVNIWSAHCYIFDNDIRDLRQTWVCCAVWKKRFYYVLRSAWYRYVKDRSASNEIFGNHSISQAPRALDLAAEFVSSSFLAFLDGMFEILPGFLLF